MIVDPGLRLWGSERALSATLQTLTEAWDRVVLVTPPGAELADEVCAHPDRYGPVRVMHAPIGLLHKRGRVAQLKAAAVLGLLALWLRPARIYLNQAGLARLLAPVSRVLSTALAIHVRLLEDVPRVTTLRGTPSAPLDLIHISDAMATAAGPATLPAGTTWHKAYDPYALAEQPKPLPQKAPFVFVGRLSHGKGPHLLIEALGQPVLADARADLYGTGIEGDSYADKLARKAEPLEGRVRMMGFCQDVMQRLPAYRFLVSTSHYEPLGRVVMEGWEAGLVPIVYAGSGGAAEMVRKSGAGLNFDNWTGEALAGALVTAQQMTDEAHHAMVSAGRAWMAQNLGLENYKRALSGILF